MTTHTTRVVVADDQRDIRSSFRLVIDSQPDMQVIGEASNGSAALDTVRRLAPHVVLMDIRMPELDGLEVSRQLMADPRTSACKVIVVTTFDLDEYVATALSIGASGFLLKRSGPTLLTEAIRAAVNGDMLVSPEITVRLLRNTTLARATIGPPAARLSTRETEVARLVAHGLEVRNRVGIATWAWENGIAHPADYT